MTAPEPSAVAEALVREYLTKHGHQATLRAFDTEVPRGTASISSRSALRHTLGLERTPARLSRLLPEQELPRTTLDLWVLYQLQKLSLLTDSKLDGAGRAVHKQVFKSSSTTRTHKEQLIPVVPSLRLHTAAAPDSVSATRALTAADLGGGPSEPAAAVCGSLTGRPLTTRAITADTLGLLDGPSGNLATSARPAVATRDSASRSSNGTGVQLPVSPTDAMPLASLVLSVAADLSASSDHACSGALPQDRTLGDTADSRLNEQVQPEDRRGGGATMQQRVDTLECSIKDLLPTQQDASLAGSSHVPHPSSAAPSPSTAQLGVRPANPLAVHAAPQLLGRRGLLPTIHGSTSAHADSPIILLAPLCEAQPAAHQAHRFDLETPQPGAQHHAAEASRRTAAWVGSTSPEQPAKSVNAAQGTPTPCHDPSGATHGHSAASLPEATEPARGSQRPVVSAWHAELSQAAVVPASPSHHATPATASAPHSSGLHRAGWTASSAADTEAATPAADHAQPVPVPAGGASSDAPAAERHSQQARQSWGTAATHGSMASNRDGTAEAVHASTSGDAELQLEDLEDFDHPLPSISHAGLPRATNDDTREAAISAEEMRALRLLLFGQGAGSGLPYPAWKQGLIFSDTMSLAFGLVQRQGGPCGVLAAVQAHVLAALWEPDKGAHLSLSQEAQQEALSTAIASILWQARVGPHAILVGSSRRASAELCFDDLCSSVSGRSCASQAALLTAVRALLPQYSQLDGYGLLLLVMSLLLSRTVRQVQSERDEPEGPLVAQYGYCSPELVNLVLIGQASANCFDGDRTLDGSVYRGIACQAQLGFLTLYEWYKYVEVGSYLKSPKLPIWVVCSESHFTVLVAASAADGRRALAADQMPFDLMFYDGLAKQEERITLSISCSAAGAEKEAEGADEALVPPLQHVIQTKWGPVEVAWHGCEPLL